MVPAPCRRLNIGCGGQYRCGYINLDGEDGTVGDICADAALIPFPDSRFERLEMIHLLEHLGYVKALHAVAEAYRVLQPGGELIIETPDPEASFALFLEDRSQEKRAQLLSWIFGLDTPGYLHRLLFPEELLRHTLEHAGFRDLRREEPRTHLYAPGLRIVATRDGLPVHNVLAHLRRWILQSGALDLSHQLQALEFESVFVDNLLALGGDSTPPADAKAAALINIVMAPEAARTWLDLCGEQGVDPPFDRLRMSLLAQAAADERLDLRLETLFAELCEKGEPDFDDGYEELCARGMAVLRKAFGGDAGRDHAVLQDDLPPADLGTDRTAGRPPLTRALLRSRVNAMHDQAVRLMCHHQWPEATVLLQRAARARVDPFYPLWNLAVAHAAQGNLDQAIRCYREALVLAHPVTEPVLLHELAICTLHARRPEEVLELALPTLRQDDRDALVRLAQEMMDLEQDARPPLLPALRSRPVLAGESLYHEPDSA